MISLMLVSMHSKRCLTLMLILTIMRWLWATNLLCLFWSEQIMVLWFLPTIPSQKTLEQWVVLFRFCHQISNRGTKQDTIIQLGNLMSLCRTTISPRTWPTSQAMHFTSPAQSNSWKTMWITSRCVVQAYSSRTTYSTVTLAWRGIMVELELSDAHNCSMLTTSSWMTIPPQDILCRNAMQQRLSLNPRVTAILIQWMQH